jgi:nicotinate dehydrogenase subunit B
MPTVVCALAYRSCARPNDPPLGVAEAAQGPSAAAIANAVHAALGVRVRRLPITREAILSASI